MSANRNPEVEAWLESYDNPQKDLLLAVRDLMLSADDRVTEVIKWQAPTFVYKGNIASFYPKTKSHVALMFHTGAALPDPTGLLEGEGATSRVARFADADDLAEKAEALQEIVRRWVAAKG